MAKLDYRLMSSSWIFSASKILMFLITTTIILKVFNVEEISIWYMFASATAFSHYFEFGIGPTIVRFIAYRSGEDDKSELFKTIGASIVIYFTLSFLVLIFSVLFVIYVKNFSQNKLSFFLWIYPAINALNFFLKFNDSALKGSGYLIKYNHWNSIFFLINAFVLSLVILIFKDLEISLLILHVLLSFNGIKNLLILKKYIDFDKLKEVFHLAHIKERILVYLRPTVETALMSISSTGISHAINIFLPALIGVNVASTYFVLQKILRVIDEFSYGPFYSYIPDLMQLWAKNSSIKTYQRIVIRTISFSIVLLIISGCMLYPVLAYLIPILKLNIYLFDPYLIVIMTLLVIIERSSAYVSQLLLIRNITSQYKIYLLSASCITLSLSLINLKEMFDVLFVLATMRFIELLLIGIKYTRKEWQT